MKAQRYRYEILRPIVVPSAAITSCFSMIMHGPMSQGSVHNSWKLKMSQFFHDLHTHQTCHPLSKCGMLWIDMYNNVFQFPPISSIFAQQLKSGTTFHNQQLDQLYARQMVTPDTDWFSCPDPYITFFFKCICHQQLHICIPSHVKSIDWGLMNLFKLTDFLI